MERLKMIDPIEELPVALKTEYTTDEPNKEIELYQGGATLQLDPKQKVHGICRLTFQWLPSPRVAFSLTVDSGTNFSVQWNAFKPKLVLDGSSDADDCAILAPGDHSLSGIVINSRTPPQGQPLAKVKFHLANWPLILGSGIRFDPPTEPIAGRIELQAEDWKITIDAVPKCESLGEKLAAIHGYGITHVGEIQRISGKLSTLDEIDAALLALWNFLSFARGGFSAPLLRVGFNSAGERAWWDARHTVCDRWTENFGWFAHEMGASLQQLWPLFFCRWQDKYWQHVLRNAIWWYVASAKQSGGSDGSIILAQAGLESLAWANLIEKQRIISHDGFKKLSSADRIRVLVNAMEVNADFPPRGHLRQLAEKRKWNVPAWALIEVRNRLVHPTKVDELDGQGDAINDAYELAVHYLELALLFTCDYQGAFTNRLTTKIRGNAEPVPWAKQTTK
jgi:hypothetical protein